MGAVLTAGLHVAVIGAVIWASIHASHASTSDAPEVTFFAPPPPPPPPPPAGGGQTKPKTERKIIPKKDVIVEPKKDQPREEPKEESKAEPETNGQAGGQVGGVVGGVAGGVVGGVVGGTVGGTVGGVLGGTGSGVIPFGEGMTKPTPLAADEFQYTREAREARISGVMIVRCTVTTDGSVTNCRIIKGVPMMDQAVLAALARHRGAPVTFQGHPVSVEYTYTIRLKMPD